MTNDNSPTEQAIRLLSSCWGAEPDDILDGTHCIAYLMPSANDAGKLVMKHIIVNTVAEAVRKSLLLSEEGKDIYFAMSVFRQGWYRDEKTGKKHLRTQANVDTALSTWLDIDCGDEKAAEGDGYPTKLAAGEALCDFCTEYNIPNPTYIVDSGNGLHVYWVYDERVHKDRWKGIAHRIKTKAKTFGLIIDNSRTGDIASVLRMPGTRNYKDISNSLPVRIVRAGDVCSLDELEDVLRAGEGLCHEVGDRNKNKLLDDLLGERGLDESDENIALVREMLAALPADCDRDTWLIIVFSVASLGWECGKDLAREWSETASDIYDKDSFDKLWGSYEPGRPDGVTIGTLVHRAKESGWVDDTVQGELTPVLDAINTRFALIQLGGKVGIVDRQQVRQVSTKVPLQIYNRQDGGLLVQRFVRVHFPEKNSNGMWETWLRHPGTTVYVGIELNPKRTTPGYLNLWRGLSIVPKRGNFKRIKRFIRNVICNRDKTLFKYLWRWMAHMLQRPEEKPGVSILLIGGQGTGKGTLAAKIIGRFFEAHFLHLQTDRSITGDFNASLESSFVIFADEAFFSGDKKASNRLKGIETEQNLQINPKYQPERQINSLHRVISASNNDHAADVEYDDRRKVVFLVSDAHKGDFAYWKDLDNEINNGGLEAIAQALLDTNLAGFEVRDKPNTAELIQQKLASLDPVSRWWADKLFEGTQYANGTRWESFVSTKDLHDDYVEHHKVHGGRGHATPQNIFIEKLKKLCLSTAPIQQTVALGGRRRGLSFPPITVARSEFEQRIGGSISW